MSDHLLILHPIDPNHELNQPDNLLQELANIGLLAIPYEWSGALHYKPGSRFLDLIAFTRSHINIILGDTDKGCKKSVELTAEHDVIFIYLKRQSSPNSWVQPIPCRLFARIAPQNVAILMM